MSDRSDHIAALHFDHLPPREADDFVREQYLSRWMANLQAPQLRDFFGDRDELGDRVARCLFRERPSKVAVRRTTHPDTGEQLLIVEVEGVTYVLKRPQRAT